MWTLHPSRPCEPKDPTILVTDDRGHPVGLGRHRPTLLAWLRSSGHLAVSLSLAGEAVPFGIGPPDAPAARAAAADLGRWLRAADGHPSWPAVNDLYRSDAARSL